MRPTTVFLCLLFVFGVLFPINLQDYLYDDESNATTEDFIALGTQYQIVYVGGTETMLLKDNQLVTNKDEIESAIYQLYLRKYYPSTSEIETITNLLNAYHASRENGDMWEGYEEKTCMMTLYMTVFPCTNASTPSFTNYSQMKGNDCYMAASIACEEYGNELGCSDPSQVFGMVQDFGLSSYYMTQIKNKTEANLASMNPENAYEVLSGIKDDIDDMEKYEKKLEETKFRIPIGGAKECKTCIGLCPPVIISEQYLKDVEEKIDGMLPELQKVDGYKEEAQRIYDETMARQNHLTSSNLQLYYTSIFTPDKTRAEKALARADNLLATVDDSEVRENAARVRMLVSEIESNIANSQFNSMNESLDELEAKTALLETGVPESEKIYNETLESRDQASAVMFTLDTLKVPAGLQGNVTALKASKRTQDRSFSTGLSPQRYSEIKEKYDGISLEGATIIERVEGGATGEVVDVFQGAGRKTNEGIADLVTTVASMEREDREEVSGYAPLVLSSLSFFSLSSLAVFLFLFAFTTFSNLFRNRVMMFFWFIVLGASILGAAVVSYGTYAVLSSSSNEASFTDFKDYALSSSEVSILVETENVSAGASEKMLECAGKLSASMEGTNAIVYKKTDGECVINGQGVTLAECYNTIKEPIIVFKYSSVDESPEFYTGFVYKGVFSGDEEYFKDCEVSKAFMSTDILDMIKLPQAETNESGADANASGNASGE